jgi:hypothetical protein
MRTLLTTIGVLGLSICLADWSQASVEVYSNLPSPGDAFTYSGGSPGGTQAIGSTGWIYNNVRNNAVIGINNTLDRSGNGSVGFQVPTGAKADIEKYGPLGTLGSLTSLGYEWYRDSASTASSHYHPSLRLFVADPITNALGYLVFELAYNPSVSAVPVDQWVSENIVTSDYNLWATGTLPGAFSDYSTTLAEWKSNHSDYLVLGISSGVGSGWDGSFIGAVDNITIGFDGDSTTYNFEVLSNGVVPEPTTILVWSGIAACAGLAYLRKKQSV